MPVLSVDVKKSRKDMAEGMSTQKVERVVKFAGKEYSVSTTALPAKGEKKGLDRVLDALNEPKQVSTIEKSSLDWDKYKEKECIEEELTQYTKNGYGLIVCCNLGFADHDRRVWMFLQIC